MAKTNQSASAAERRAQQREQRQRSQTPNTRNRRYQRRRNNSLILWLIGGAVVVVIIAVIVISSIVSSQQQQNALKSATPDVFSKLTSISPDLLNRVGTGSVGASAGQILKPVKNTPVLHGPNGKPEVFYMGGEFCPYCAAQRWGMIVALSRFGTFTKPLTPIISAEDNIPTYTFYKSSYKSNYIDFVPVEVSDNNFPANNLEPLSPDQQNLVNTYDAPPYVDAQSKGSFPFVDVGNQYVTTGAYYDPQLLVGTSHDKIMSQIQDPTSDISRAILGSANYFTAQFCQVTQNQPASVCNAGPVPSVQQKLPKTSVSTNNTLHLASFDMPAAVPERKKVS